MQHDPKKLAIMVGIGAPHDGEADGGDDHEAVKRQAAQDLIDSVHAKDVDGVVSALEAAFYACDAEPNPEGSHPESGEDEGGEEHSGY